MTEQDYAVIGIDAAQIAYVYGWGFAAVIAAWFMGFVVGAAVDLIRKA